MPHPTHLAVVLLFTHSDAGNPEPKQGLTIWVNFKGPRVGTLTTTYKPGTPFKLKIAAGRGGIQVRRGLAFACCMQLRQVLAPSCARPRMRARSGPRIGRLPTSLSGLVERAEEVRPQAAELGPTLLQGGPLLASESPSPPSHRSVRSAGRGVWGFTLLSLRLPLARTDQHQVGQAPQLRRGVVLQHQALHGQQLIWIARK